MPMLDRERTNIYYEVAGPGDGRTLLLSHGFAASAHMWAANLPALSADYQVITWDLRGHARSDSPSDPSQYSTALAIGDMVALLDLVGATQAVVGGQSLGGYLSLEFCMRHPQRVAALILVDTGPGYRRDEPRDNWNATAQRRAENFEREGLGALGTGSSSEVRTAPHRSAEGLARAARGMMVQHDSRVMESLPSITAPTLIVVGAMDTAFLDAADVMAAKIPNATKVVLDSAGHAANVDQPEAFNQTVLRFLASV
jgi:pimeloyl-ACP methyl ester carboxylesterase